MKAKRTKSVNVIWTVLFAKYLFLEEICNYIEPIWWNIPRDRYLFALFSGVSLRIVYPAYPGVFPVVASLLSLLGGGGVVGTPLYKPYRYRFCPILVWNRVWFSRELLECSKWVRKKEKYADSEWILRNLFCCCSNLSNDDIISYRPGLRMGMDYR